MSPTESSKLQQIHEVTAYMRGVWERILEDSLGSQETEGTCLYAAALLSTILAKFAEVETHVRGGGPPMDGGLLDKTGQIRGHYWVECETGDGEPLIIDITADQFDYEKIVILPLSVGSRRYTPGNQALIDEHTQEVFASIERDQNEAQLRA